jgi:predicted Holliday junction resolvase-like endonuclease
MSQNKVQTLFVFLLIVAAAIIVKQSLTTRNLREDLEIRNIDFKRKDKQLRLHIDSLQVVKKKLAAQDEFWSKQVKEQLDLLVIERAKTDKYRKKYEVIKNTPTPNWNSTELDSLLESVLRH